METPQPPHWYTEGRPQTQTLGDVDRKYFRLRTAAKWLAWVWVSAVIATVATVILHWRDDLNVNLSDATEAVNLSVGAATALGGISAATFFVTAELRVAGVSRRGLIELYRVRLFAPLLSSITVIVLASIAFYALEVLTESQRDALALFCLLSLVPLLVSVTYLALLTLVHFEPISIASHFAECLSFEDVNEWQLLDLHIQTHNKRNFPLGIRVHIRSNRTNFGLRDPLMPIQELVEHSKNKELGRLESVLLERIAVEYGLPWTSQAPDPEQWNILSETKARDTGASGPSSSQDAYRRLSLLLLILHYFRRLPTNKAITEVPADNRRQQTQFLLCRFAFLLAETQPSHHMREAEQRTALILTIYAIAGLSSAFRNVPMTGKMEPVWALVQVAVALRKRGWNIEYELVIKVLSWTAAKTPHINEFWKDAKKRRKGMNELDFVLRDLRRRSRQRVSESYPVANEIEDPWRDLIDFRM